MNQSLIEGQQLDAANVKSLAQELLSKGGNVSFGNLKEIVSGESNAFGSYDVNFDPTTPEQEKNNAAVKGQMNTQYNAQQALETSVASQNKMQPPPGTVPPKSGGITAAAFETGSTPAPDGSDGSGYNAAQLSDIVKVKLPNGAVITVPKNSNIARTYGVFNEDQAGAPNGSGAGGVQGGVPGANSNGATGPQTQAGQAPGAAAGAGSQPSLLSPQLENMLKSMEKFYADQKAQGQTVAPDLKLSKEVLDSFLDEATKSLSPWHAQQIQQGRMDLENELKFNAEEQKYGRGLQDADYMQQQEQTAAAAAERGIADSGIRALAESRLKDQYTGLVESTRRRFEQQQRAVGLQAERTLGSANMPNLAGIPAVEGVGYKQQGGLTGTLESQQLKEIGNKQAELAIQKRINDASFVK